MSAGVIEMVDTESLEPVFITEECRIAVGFCHSARQKIAGILGVFQDFLTPQGGKKTRQDGVQRL